MAEVFVSYATEDRARAKALAEALEVRGYSVWWDRKIPLGQSFDSVIEAAIAAARCVIVLWSRASVTSEWVRSEASEGKRRGILVPVFLDPVDAPLAFRLLNGANLSAWDSGTPHAELDKLVERVGEILEHRAARESVVGVADAHGSASIARQRHGFRRHWLLAVTAVLLIAGAIYAAYMVGTLGRQSTSHRVDTAAAPSNAGAAKSEPVSASDASGISDIIPRLPPSILEAGMLTATVIAVKDLGLHVAFLSSEQAAASGMPAGAVVVIAESDGAGAGLHVRDVIMAVNQHRIASEDDLRRALGSIGRGKSQFVIKRGKETMIVEIVCRTC